MNPHARKPALLIRPLVVGQMATNCYLVVDAATRKTVIVDPGDDASYILGIIDRFSATPATIIATHGHFDHIMAAFELQQFYKIPFVVHQGDVFLVERMRESASHLLGWEIVEPPPVVSATITAGQVIPLGKSKLHVVHTPGHTPGGICLYSGENSMVITGDTIFAAGEVGRTDFSYSRPALLTNSLKWVLSLPAKTKIFPGHGEATTVIAQRQFHPI